MIKFAFFGLFKITIFLVLSIIPTGEIFGMAAAESFQNPLQKCWELDNPQIDEFASDNALLVISQTDGNIFSLDKKTSEQIWTISIGEKGSSRIEINSDKIIITTVKETNGSEKTKEKRLFVRNIDISSGVVKDLKEFTDLITEINAANPDKKHRYYLNSKFEIGKLDFENNSLKWFPTDLKSDEIKIAADNGNSIVFKNGPEIIRIENSFPTEKRVIKNPSKEVTTLEFIENSLFWGDDSGNVYREIKNKKGFEKIFRTGGEISFLQDVNRNILVTSNDNYIYLYSPKNRKLIWKKRLSGRVTVKPQHFNNLIAVTANAEPEILFIDPENGKSINFVNLGTGSFIKDFQMDKDFLYVQTNSGLIKFGENCTK